MKFIKYILGSKLYCRTFHTTYRVGKKKGNLYHCPTCNITQYRSPFTDFGPG